MTLNADVKNKIIQMHLGGKSRNQISSETRYARDTVSKILRIWREGQSQNKNNNDQTNNIIQDANQKDVPIKIENKEGQQTQTPDITATTLSDTKNPQPAITS